MRAKQLNLVAAVYPHTGPARANTAHFNASDSSTNLAASLTPADGIVIDASAPGDVFLFT